MILRGCCLNVSHVLDDISFSKAKLIMPSLLVYVLTDATGAILAHGSVRKVDATCAWFGLLAVDVNHQNKGLGGKVLAYAEDYATREWGSTRMEFDVVNTRAELIAWYKRRGYQETGATTAFPYEYHGDWKDTLRSDLHFVVFAKDLNK